VPPSITAPTPGAEPPPCRANAADPLGWAGIDCKATEDDWVVFGDAQTGQLDTANTHKQAIVQIVTACEKRDAEIAKELQPKRFLGVF
jgi:hypothetical protein